MIPSTVIASFFGVSRQQVLRWGNALGVPQVGSGHVATWTLRQVRALLVLLVLHGDGGLPRGAARARLLEAAHMAADAPGQWLCLLPRGPAQIVVSASEAVAVVQQAPEGCTRLVLIPG